MSPRKATSEAKLRWFQFRIIHRILPTKRYLNVRKVIDSAECSFCGNEEETIEHLFWNCDIVTRFWNEFLTILKAKLCTQYELFSWYVYLSHCLFIKEYIRKDIVLKKKFVKICSFLWLQAAILKKTSNLLKVLSHVKINA